MSTATLQTPQRPLWLRSPAVLGLLALLLALAAASLYYKGWPMNRATPEADNSQREAAQTSQASADRQELATMVGALRERLKGHPDDPEGWAMLGRSLVLMGDIKEAVAAYEKATTLRRGDAQLLTEYADALAAHNGKNFQGRPTELLNEAIKADPTNPSALSLAGLAAFDRGDHKLAISYWEQFLASNPGDSGLAAQVRRGLAEARQLAYPNAVPSSFANGEASRQVSASTVSGVVEITEELRSLVSPDDVVYIFAKAPTGTGLPLAVLLKQVKDLPLTFVLDQTTAMSPDTKLSSMEHVTVVARISKSGQPTPQVGDLEGRAMLVKPGASDVRISINKALEGIAGI